MKRFLPPALLFLGVFLVTLLAQKYTFVDQEQNGLFLLSRDYFAGRFAGPLPVSGILGDFLAQFFRFSFYAPAIVAAGVTVAFLLLRGTFRRLRVRWNWVPMVPAVALWIAVAFAHTPQRGVFLVLVCAGLWLLSRLLPAPKKGKGGWIDAALCALLVAAGAGVIVLQPSLRRREILAETQYAVTLGNWDRVLAVATPERCAADETLTPLALLALGEKGMLGDRLFDYPVRGEDDFDCCDRSEEESAFFRVFLNERLGSNNEAVHALYQLAATREQGMSFLVLRQLLVDYYRLGDYALAEKYCAVLSRSLCHGPFVRRFRREMAAGKARTPDTPAARGVAPLASRDPLHHLYLLEAAGIHSPAAVDRILCTLLLRGETEAFRTLFDSVHKAGDPVPRYYQNPRSNLAATSREPIQN